MHRRSICVALVGWLIPASLLGQGRLELTRIWATKGRLESPFGNVAGVVHTASRAIIVSDDVANVLYRLSSDGTDARVLARAGGGPGEVRGPNLLSDTPDGGFAVYDISKRGVLLFDRELNPAAEVKLEGFVQNPKGMAVLADGMIVLSGGMFDSAYGVHLFSQAGELVRSFEKNPVTHDPTAGIRIAGGALAPTKSGGFLFSLSAPHRITRYTVEGDAQLVASDAKLLEPIGDDVYQYTTVEGRRVRMIRWWYAQSRFVAERSDGSVLNVITRRETGDSVWELWSSSGELIGRTTVPVAYRPWSMSRYGFVLATFSDPDTDETVLANLRVGTSGM